MVKDSSATERELCAVDVEGVMQIDKLDKSIESCVYVSVEQKKPVLATVNGAGCLPQ